MDPEQGQTSSKPSRRPWLWAVLIIILITAGVLIALWWSASIGDDASTNAPATSNSNVTSVLPAGWLTYANTKYQYRFSYPSSWIRFNSPGASSTTGVEDSIAFGDGNLSVEVDVPAQEKCEATSAECIDAFRRLRDEYLDSSTGIAGTSVDGVTAYTETRDAIFFDATATDQQRHNKRVYYYLMRGTIIVSIKFEYPAESTDAEGTVEDFLRHFQIDW